MKERVITAVMLLLVCSGLTGEILREVLGQPSSNSESERVKRIVETYKKLDKLLGVLESEGPPRGKEIDLVKWEYEVMSEIRATALQLGYLFRDKPCPAAVAELMLEQLSSSGYFDHEMFSRTISNIRSKNGRISYLEVLNGADMRAKEKLPELRKHFIPDFDLDDEFVVRFVKAGQPLPKWYVDRAFTCDWDDILNTTDLSLKYGCYGRWSLYRGSSVAAVWLSRFEDGEFFLRSQQDVRWSVHVIETYGFRRRLDRDQPQDAEQARKQLKWLWETKRWWARRYVVEVLNISPELAFEGIIEELKKQQHPHVGYRIADLKLIEKLEKQKPKP